MTGDSGSGTICLWLRTTDELLVPTGLSSDAGAVFATSILQSILRTTSSIHEQHEDADSKHGSLATNTSYRRTPDSKRAFTTGPATHHGNICNHATPVPYAMKLFIDRLIVTYGRTIGPGAIAIVLSYTYSNMYVFKFLMI